MKFEKIVISQEKFDINLKFYYMLKYLVKAKLTDNQAKSILKICILNIKDDYLGIKYKITDYVNHNIKQDSAKQQICFDILDEINGDLSLKLFVFSLKLYLIKDLLLAEAKAQDLFDIAKLEELHPLSLEYDKITVYSPYSTRVNGALLSLIFFDNLSNYKTNFISKHSDEYLKDLSKVAVELTSSGVEPNQIFMLLFSESINQSIISDSGSNYESRILTVLK